MAANETGKPIETDARHPFKDALKAVAGEGQRARAAEADPDKTALLNRAPGQKTGVLQDAIKAVEAALGQAPAKADVGKAKADDVPPTLAVRGGGRGDVAKTQIVRGKTKPTRSDFHHEPVVAWLVVIGGPGLGSFRPLYEGNNTIGRGAGQRVTIDFGDDSISSEEQAYLRYDSTDRSFLFVPNLAKTNIVRVNDDKPTAALKLSAMDVITMGRTQLVFVPFCGDEFDWSDLTNVD